MDMEYLNMVKQTFNTPYYYFSYTYDLTHTMQRLYNTSSFVNVRIFSLILYKNINFYNKFNYKFKVLFSVYSIKDNNKEMRKTL